MSDWHWVSLLDRIANGCCVPIIGAAANVDDPHRGYSGLPLAADVALELARHLWPDDARVQRGELDMGLAEVALASRIATDRDYLIENLQQLLNDQGVEPSPLLQTLATLPFSLIVTTNFDCLLERALDRAGRDYIVVSQPSGGFDRADLHEVEKCLARPRGAVVYKLHGSFGGDSPELVVEEDDYISFMRALASGDGVPRTLSSMLATSTLLCVGYSIRDWDFRMLIGQVPRHQRKMFAVLRDPSSFWVDYLQSSGYWVVDAHVYDFADELAERWAARVSSS